MSSTTGGFTPKPYTRLLIICGFVVAGVVLTAIIGVMGVLSFHTNDTLHFWQFISGSVTPTLAGLGTLGVAFIAAKYNIRTNTNVRELSGRVESMGSQVDQVQKQTNGHMGDLISKIPADPTSELANREAAPLTPAPALYEGS